MDTSDLRQKIDSLIASEGAAGASRSLAELWSLDKSSSAASFVVSRYEELRSQLNLVPYRVAVLRSFTVEPIVPLLRAAAFCAGIDFSIYLSEFNAYNQEIFDPDSALYSFRPDAVFLAVQTRDIAPELWRDFSALSTEQIQETASRVPSEFRKLIEAFRSRSQAHLVIHNLELPEFPSSGLLDSQAPYSQASYSQAWAIQEINRALQKAASESAGVYILDYDALAARYGRAQWHDERKWLTVRLPISSPNLIHLASEWLRFLHPLTGKLAKVLAVDLDNTLWGGVIGEDGISGIRLGGDYPGAAFQEVQRALLDLHHRGVLLAICSKNNQADALEALNTHPGMLLKPSHFAATRINWNEKSRNLREIAGELSVGIDSVAFLDDNPIEREQVRSQLPEVHVIELQNDPMSFAGTIRGCPLFETLTLSAEDRQRGNFYQAQQDRQQLEQKIESREDFYRSLLQEAEIAPLTKATLPRIAQLTNKTNQFNLTTRRYTEQQISEMVSSPEWNCFSLQVRDRFGDNGLVGVAITRREGKAVEIDTMLLSCRVIGRTVETAFLSFLAQHAQQQGAEKLQGWFLPTKKNAPASEFYSAHGFEMIKQNGQGTLWNMDLKQKSVSCPEWIRLHVVNGDQPNAKPGDRQ